MEFDEGSAAPDPEDSVMQQRCITFLTHQSDLHPDQRRRVVYATAYTDEDCKRQFARCVLAKGTAAQVKTLHDDSDDIGQVIFR